MYVCERTHTHTHTHIYVVIKINILRRIKILFNYRLKRIKSVTRNASTMFTIHTGVYVSTHTHSNTQGHTHNKTYIVHSSQAKQQIIY